MKSQMTPREWLATMIMLAGLAYLVLAEALRW
jgi:hypothetical protein